MEEFVKKVLSFSLWGNNPKYLRGGVKNAELIPKFYPGWTGKFYIHKDVNSSIVKEIQDLGAEVQIITEPPDWRGMFWRFYAFDDPSVSVFCSRDTDSRLNEREAECVNEWLNSDKLLYSTKDHPFHDACIMGGAFGVKRELNVDFKDLITKYEEKGQFYQVDQNFLKDIIWPLAKDKSIIFDCLNRNEFTKTVPFPSRRPVDGSFVGEVFDELDRPNWTHRKVLALAESQIYKF